MKKGWWFLNAAGLVLALAATPCARAFGAVVASSSTPISVLNSSAPMDVVEHPRQYLAQAYPAVSQPLAGVADDRCFDGIRQGENTGTAVPGLLCLDTTIVNGVPRLNLNSFVTCPSGQTQPFVQSYRLIKNVPGSAKCPMTFSPRVYYQFGTGIRTWWALQFTQPGTTFTLELTVRCLDPRGRQLRFHVDRWTWEVIATLDTFENLIHLLHTNAVGTTEVPCIVGEDIYAALLDGLQAMRDAQTQGHAKLQDAFFNLEGLVTTFCAFGEVLEPEAWFDNNPPGNAAPTGPMGIVGIIETTENPCCCKLLVDLEYIGTQMVTSN
jgi:hypothetical protein